MRSLLLFLLLSATALADIKLASPFSSHMVLQRDMKVPVWGTANPREKITIRFAQRKYTGRANDEGHWRIDLPPMSASTRGHPFIVSGAKRSPVVQLDDVLVGEVWICSGQSNMERQLGPRPGQQPIENWEQEAASADFPLIRQLYVKQTTAFSPQTRVDAQWTVCSPSTAAEFTAVGFFFARELFQKLDVPIGIIHTSWGGTPVEAWTSAEGLKSFPEFAEAVNSLHDAAHDPTAAERAYRERLAAWYRQTDPGEKEPRWNEVNLDVHGWESMTLPTMWETAGHPNYDGLVWFRKTFDLPPTWKGTDVELRLSAIDDADTTWVNGTEVGGITGWNTPRVYRVPGSTLKPTGNVIAVRVLDTAGNGGIWNPKAPFEVAAMDNSFAPIPLRGPWSARFAVRLDGLHRPPVNVQQDPGSPTTLYNGMVAPLVPYAIRGVTFYQGEANAERAHQYRTLFPAMIADWRRQWHQGDFPFLFVQIAPFKDMPPEIREAQLIAAQTTKHTAMAVTIDCGDANDIHPTRKRPVGERLAVAARAIAYNEPIEFSGPLFESFTTADGRAVLHFTHVGRGLVAKSGTLKGFSVAAQDGVYHPADATISSDTVVVTSPAVREPKHVRYAWANVPEGNLFNEAGLPASPFRTDVEP